VVISLGNSGGFMKLAVGILAISSVVILGSCGKKEVVTETILVHSAENPVITAIEKKSQKIQTEKLDAHRDFALSIKREALGENNLFLMGTTFIDSLPVPMGTTLGSKIVYFEEKGDHVFLFESTRNKLASPSLKTKILLATFPILEQTEEIISFDFGAGMTELITVGSDSTSADEESGDSVVQISKSFVDSVKLKGAYILIDQYVRIQVQVIPSSKSGTVDSKALNGRIKYSFSTYNPSKTFIPVVAKAALPHHFFTTNPLNSGLGSSLLIKRDMSQPFTFYLSANTPAQYRQAITDGVLYWNKAIGRNVISVDILPQDQEIHEPNLNVVQWVDFSTAAYSYADMEVDPFTGEITGSHVYLTSPFASTKLAYSVLNRLVLDRMLDLTNKKLLVRPTLKGFSSNVTATAEDKRKIKEMADVLQENIEANASSSKATLEEAIRRFALDSLRETVAHEVGHTLGLRHNFAASNESNIDANEQSEIMGTYFITGEIHPDLIPATSMMDYNPNSSFIGAKIRLNQAALPYDRAVIAWSEGTINYSLLRKNIFCTDEDQGKFEDCRAFDGFANPFDSWARQWTRTSFDATELVLSMVEFSNIAPDMAAQLISMHPLDPAGKASEISTLFDELLSLLSPEANFIAVDFAGFFMSAMDTDERKDAVRLYQAKGLKLIGGLEKVILQLTPVIKEKQWSLPFVDVLRSQFTKTLDLPEIKALSPASIEAMKVRASRYFKELEKELLFQTLRKIETKPLVASDATLTKTITTLLTTVLFEQGPSIIDTISTKKSLLDPIYGVGDTGEPKGSFIFMAGDTSLLDEVIGQNVYAPLFGKTLSGKSLRAQALATAKNITIENMETLNESLMILINRAHEKQISDIFGSKTLKEIAESEDTSPALQAWALSELKLFQE
jgi:hypothetical protein